ncbi:hypothetical protein PENSPDRAFT_694315 [Peniophora sp. CONT]|nr:hypothetical protein PENSPDRAFT_694315 [Peniophora sp. CONT]
MATAGPLSSFKHSLDYESLKGNLKDNTVDIQKHVGPMVYVMHSGYLKTKFCCESCPVDGRDPRVFSDASRLGNISRLMSHFCELNTTAFSSMMGSDAEAVPVPVILATRTIKCGEVLSIPYWDVRRLSKEQQAEPRSKHPDIAHNSNICLYGSMNCPGWITLSP